MHFSTIGLLGLEPQRGSFSTEVSTTEVYSSCGSIPRGSTSATQESNHRSKSAEQSDTVDYGRISSRRLFTIKTSLVYPKYVLRQLKWTTRRMICRALDDFLHRSGYSVGYPESQGASSMKKKPSTSAFWPTSRRMDRTNSPVKLPSGLRLARHLRNMMLEAGLHEQCYAKLHLWWDPIQSET